MPRPQSRLRTIPERIRRPVAACRALAPVAIAALSLSLILRIAIRDDFSAARWNFYIPIPLHFAAMAVCFVLVKWKSKWRVAGLAAVAAILYIIVGYRESFLVYPAPSDAPADIKLLEYNVMAYWVGEEKIFDTIARIDPDVLCLVEGTFGGRKPDKLSKSMGADYMWAISKNLSIASRFPVRESREVVAANGVRMLRAVLDTPKGDVAVYAIDVRTPRFRTEDFVVEEIQKALIAETLPAIMAGDFNIPRGSAVLERATRGWSSSVSASTQWCPVSWPSLPLPLWQIDHAFSANGAVPLRSHFDGSRASDHLPLVVEYAIGAPALR